jgi:hypothetical protein
MMAQPLNTPTSQPASRLSTALWLLWIVIASAMIVLGLALPRWWPTFAALRQQSPTEHDRITPATEAAHPSSLLPRFDTMIAGVILVWMVGAWIIVWRRSPFRSRSVGLPSDRYQLAQLVLPCGCWLQLIHLGERRLIAGHDRTGIRVLLELPPSPVESTPSSIRVSDTVPSVSSPVSEGVATDPRTASILALFQKLKAATQASS